MFGLLFSELLTVELGMSTRQSCLTICFITRGGDLECQKSSVKNLYLGKKATYNVGLIPFCPLGWDILIFSFQNIT